MKTFPRTLVLLTCVVWSLLLGTHAPSHAQLPLRIDPNALSPCDESQRFGLPAGFEIDGNATCGPDLPNPFPPSYDWFGPPSGLCIGVIQGCRLSLPSDAPFGAFFVDPNWAIGSDPTTFKTRSNKNNDNIDATDPGAGWNWGSSNGYPQKNDITEVYGLIRTTVVEGVRQTYLILGAATRASEGDEHIDFEWNTTGFRLVEGSPDGRIVGLGPDNGRLAFKDFILTIDFRNGGVEPVDTIRVWNGTEFCLPDDAACLGQPLPPIETYAATNCSFISTPCPVTDPDGQPANGYTARQFVEVAINLTSLGIALPDLADTSLSHVMVKTRSSASFTAELKDFAMIGFQGPIQPVCLSLEPIRSGPTACGDTLTFCSTVSPTDGVYTYSWTVVGGTPVGPTDGPCLKVRAGDASSLDVSLLVTRNGIPAKSLCSASVPLAAMCEITPINPLRVLAPGDTATYCVSVSPPLQPGATQSFQWTVTGATALSPLTGECITVMAGATPFTLAVDITRPGCTPIHCELPVGINDCSITAKTLTSIACGDTASFCGNVNTTLNQLTYQWLVTGGTFVGSSTGRCVTVRAGSGSSYLLKFIVTRKGVQVARCSLSVGIEPVTCFVTPARTTCIEDTMSFCAGVSRPVQPGGSVTFNWAVVNGTIVGGSATSSCITVRPSPGATRVIVDPRITRNSAAGCPPLSCPREFEVCPDEQPPRCEIRPLVSGVIFCGDTATFCAFVEPPGGTLTYQWSITGGQFLTSATESCVKVKANGSTSFTLTLVVTRNGLTAPPCMLTVPISPPKCEITVADPTRAMVCGDTATFCVNIIPGGGTVTYEWTVVGGTIETSPLGQCVRVRAGTGTEFTVRVRARRNNCPIECERTFSLGTVQCVIEPVDPTRALACGDTASFCAAVTPSTGTIIYNWTVTGGTLLTSPNARCVRVRAGTTGTMTIRMEAMRNGCVTACEREISLGSIKCEIVPVDPTRVLACGDTASFRAIITPPGGATSFQWTITGGSILTSPSASAVRIRAGAGGAVTLVLEAGSGKCVHTCDRTIPINTFTCEVVPVDPSRALTCGDTASFRVVVSPAGATSTFAWTIDGGTILTSPSASAVRIRAGLDGDVTLTVLSGSGECAVTCSRTIPLGPIKCEIVPADPTRVISCGDTATFVAIITPPGGASNFMWTIVGGSIETSPSLPYVRVKAGATGSFTLTLEAGRGKCTHVCDRTVSVPHFKCEITPINPDRVLACGDTMSFRVRLFPPGGTGNIVWRIVGGTILTSPFSSVVTIRASTAGEITLSVEVSRDGKCTTTCDLTFPAIVPKCEIVPTDPTRVYACGDTASFCASVFPSAAGTTFQWTITGGIILSSSTAQCVRVRFGTSGEFTLRVEISRGAGKCVSSCDRTFPIAPLECEIRPSGPPRSMLACGDTISFCAVANASGVTYEWVVIGGTPITPTTGSCITVRVTGGGELVVRTTVRRADCVATCEARIPTVGPFCAITGEPRLCPGDSATYCTPFVSGATYLWSVSGNGSIFPPFNASCVTARAGTGSGPFRLIVRVTQGACAVACTIDVTVRPTPPPPVTECKECEEEGGYPDESHLPQSKGVIDHDQVMRAFDPKTPGPLGCVVTDTVLRVFYSSDRVMLLGYRQVQVKTSSGITTVNFPVPTPPTSPTCVREPNLGDTIATGDLRYGDWYERPVFPALWITDITNDQDSRAGDFRIGLVESLPDTGAIPPDKVCGLWKYAVRFYDKTRSGGPRATTISDYPDPPKNFWNLGAGSDVPTEGFANVPNGGYGAEAAWNLTNRGLVPGRMYRLFFSVYEGGDNPHPNYGCVNIIIPGGGTDSCPAPAALVGNETGELEKPSSELLGPRASDPSLGRTFALLQNQPNPFDRSTMFLFSVAERSQVSIEVYSIEGRKVGTLVGGEVEAGSHRISWTPVDDSGRKLAPGVYLYRMVAASASGRVHERTRKMVLLK